MNDARYPLEQNGDSPERLQHDADRGAFVLPCGWEVSDALPVHEVAKQVQKHRTSCSECIADERPVRGPGVRLTRLADVEPEIVSWLWPGRIPLGKISVLDGDPGMGKTTLALDITARITSHRPLPDRTRGDVPGKGNVLILTAEDGLGDTIRPRLDAADADVERVFAMSIEDALGTRGVTFPNDWGALKSSVTLADVNLVIVDPLVAFLGDDVNTNRDHDVRRALAPLARLAEETHVAVLLIRHLNKASGGRAIYRGGGSIGIAGAARSALLAAEDPNHEHCRVLAVVKSNLAEKPKSLRYQLVQASNGVSRIEWIGDCEYTADSLLTVIDGEERVAIDDAKDFLEAELEFGPRKVDDLYRDARKHGISDRTLRRAKGKLRITSRRVGFGPDSHVEWSILANHEGLASMERPEALNGNEATTSHTGQPHTGQGHHDKLASMEKREVWELEL